jgi:transposase-like protein
LGLFYNPNKALSTESLSCPGGVSMDELALFCCQNPKCTDYGRRGQGNLRVCFCYGKDQRRMLACRTCQKRFSERKGTALFGLRLPQSQALAVFAHLQDGCGVRQTGRLTGVDKDTVVRYALRAGSHARNSHEELVAFSPFDPGSPAR